MDEHGKRPETFSSRITDAPPTGTRLRLVGVIRLRGKPIHS
jgi:hypothetical protein